MPKIPSPLVRALLLPLYFLLALPGCERDSTTTEAAVSMPLRELDWLELMPEDELQALQEEAPAVTHDGDFKALQQGSSRTVQGMDGQRVRIPGYVVPIDSDADGQLLEFFLVPYFGACIHVPPPPPNQIIHAQAKPALPMTDIYAAYWVEGVLQVQHYENETAATAYRLRVERLYLWE